MDIEYPIMNFSEGEFQFQLPIYKKLTDTEIDYTKELFDILTKKKQGMIEIVKNLDKVDNSLNVLLNFKYQFPKIYKKIYICCSNLNDAQQYSERCNQILQKTANLKQLNILKMSKKKHLCIQPEFLQNFRNIDDEYFCKYKRKVQNDCQYNTNFLNKQQQNQIIQEKNQNVFDSNQLKEVAKKQEICPYFYMLSLIENADIIICTHSNLFQEAQKDVYQFIKMEANSFLFLDQSQFLYEDIRVFNTQHVDILMVHNSINACIQLKQRVLDNKIVDINQIEKYDIQYQKLLQNLQKGVNLHTQTQDNIPGNIKNPLLYIEFVQKGCYELSLIFQDKLRRQRDIFLKKASNLKEKKLQEIFQSYLSPINKRSLKYIKYIINELLPFLKIYLKEDDSEKNYSFEDLRVVIEFLFNINQRFNENGKLNPNFFLFFQEEPEYRNDLLFQPILTIAPNKINTITQNILKNISFAFTSSSIIQLLEGQNIISQIFGLNPKIEVKRFELENLVKYNIMPIFITKWNDQSKFQSTTGDKQLQIRNYLNVITEVSQQTPDGIIVYLPDIKTMKILSEIKEIQKTSMNQLQKPLFFENPYDQYETYKIYQYFQQSCDHGCGGVFFCVARGYAAKNIQFKGYYGRCVLILGYPERQYNQNFFKYGNQLLNLGKSEFMTFDTMTTVSQCLQSIYTFPEDYGIMILADEKLKKQCEYLPKWAKQNLKWQEEMTVNDFISTILYYYKVMGKISRQ